MLASLAVWSGHFQSTFQDDDSHIILKNRAVQDAANIPHFFSTPLLYADRPELAEYRPLALVSLAFDYWLARPINAAVFEADSFVWFLLGAVFFGIICLLLPGADRRMAIPAVALFAFHPLAGEALNYISRRGDLIGAAGVTCGLAIWIVWPRHLPAEILHWDRHQVPKTEWDDWKRRWAPTVNARYRAFVEAPLGLYLVPVVPAMLADPGAAVFPLLLTAWILLFERNTAKRRVLRRILPSAIVCGGYWAAELAFTWKYGAGYRLPLFSYWVTEPWVVMRYLWDYFVPVGLTPESGFPVFPHPWSPLAIAGFVGLAGLIALALDLGRRKSWRKVSFGLWWFLIALLPGIMVPRRAADADYRMYLPLMGLALATAAAGWNLYERTLSAATNRLKVQAIAAGAAAVVLVACCAMTIQRNRIWGAQTSFWEDALRKNPQNGRAWVELGAALIADDQPDQAYADLKRAAPLVGGDAPDEISLAQAFDQMNRDFEAQDYFQRALKAGPAYASAWSAWSRWLVVRGRFAEAFQAASQALRLSPWNVEAEHTLLDYYSADSNWPALRKEAESVLHVSPNDPDARRALDVAQAGFAALSNAESKAKSEPTVDDFLALSVEYYKAHRYNDVIVACNQALKLKPDLAEAYHNMAAAYHALGKNDDAIHALREAIRIRPDLAIARSNLEFLLTQQQESQKTPPPGHPPVVSQP